MVDSKKMENLMNLIMQFRKVCNHPELFERRLGKTPLIFKVNPLLCCPSSNLIASIPEVNNHNKSPLRFEIPKMIYDEVYNLWEENALGGGVLKTGGKLMRASR